MKKNKISYTILLSIAIIILASFITKGNANEIGGEFLSPPSKSHILGTDEIGRDVFSRVILGTITSLFIGCMSSLIATCIGSALGLIAGYFGGIVDAVIMRITDMIMSFPYMLLVLVASSVFGPGMINVILILGCFGWPMIARMVRGKVLSLKDETYVKSAVIMGFSKKYILFKEILPNIMADICIFATSMVAYSMLDEAALSFLGMGVQPPKASLGNMLGDARSLSILTDAPWVWAPPGIIIILIVVSISFIGDGYQERFKKKRH